MWWHTRRNQISSFGRNGRVHLKRQGRQLSRLLAAEVCASAVVMLDTPCSEVVWCVLATHSTHHFPLHFPSLSHRVPSHFNWTLPASPPPGPSRRTEKKVTLGRGFLCSVVPCKHNFTNIPPSSSSLCSSYQKGKWRGQHGNAQDNAVSAIR